MTDACERFRPRIDARVDGEIEDADLDAHLRACADCRAERDARAALKRSLGRVVLPAPPRAFDRALLRPERRTWWPATAAAGLLVAVLFFSMPGAVPDLLAQSARLHEDVTAGRLKLGDLGLRPTASRAEIPTGCPCPPDLGDSAPFVVYGQGDRAISCLALDDPRPRAASWHRLGRNSVLVRSRRGLLEIWISRDRASLESWLRVDDAREAGAPWSLREFT
jgi:hypothetical protein